MTKVIAIFIIVLVLYGGWEMFLYWDKVKNEEQASQKQAAAAVIDPNNLPGLPQNVVPALHAAEKQGAVGLKNFLRDYNRVIQDPRKAWIEIEYVLMITRDNPQEAKRIFAEVKDRTPPTSPVWPKIQQLEKTYQ